MLNSLIGIIASSGGAAGAANSYESIATVTVGSPVSSITFSSIPSIYQHLQIRAISKNTTSGQDAVLSLNGNSIGYRHFLYGDGSTNGSGSDTSGGGVISAASTVSNTFAVFVMDILDYTNTNKNKTVRALQGGDYNGSGVVAFNSWLYSTNTNAITSLTLTSSGTNFAQYSSFALYGIKG
jgi:hypothetical protein